jgi:hypothetical protein
MMAADISRMGPVRSSRRTIATSAAIAHQKATAAGSEAVALHARLQPEKPRKNNTQKKHGKRSSEAKGFEAGPIE